MTTSVMIPMSEKFLIFYFLIACTIAPRATFFSNFDDAVLDICWMSFCRAMLKNLCFVRFQREGTAACVIIIVA